MPVSFSPAFDPDGHTVAGNSPVYTFASLTPGVPLLAAFLVIDETFDSLSVGTELIDEFSWSDSSSGLYAANFQMLHVLPAVAATSFVMSGTATAVGVVGQFPAGIYGQLAPHAYTDVPGVPGEVYANPQELNNVSALHSYISAWMPTGRGPAFGAVFSHTYDIAPATLDLQTVVGADFEESDLATTSFTPFGGPNDPLTIQAKAFAIETSENPVEIRVNEANAGEFRWAATLGAHRRNRWRVGVIGR